MSMQPKKDEEIVYHAPERLLAVFLKGRIVLWLIVAVAIHVVLVGFTSLGYIRDRWIDPDGAAARKKAATATPEAAKPPPPAVVTNRPAAPATNAAAASTEQRLMEERSSTPVVKRITAKAATNDLPKQPGDLGLSIEDTNIR
jgi:hypothetical protein